jgi:Fic family protein
VTLTRLSGIQREDAWIYDLRMLNGRVRKLKGVPSVRTRVVSTADSRGWSYRSPAGDRVAQELKSCLREFYRVLDKDPAAPTLIYAGARLWLRLMTIRPFMDGNRRTARAFLARCFTQQGLAIKNFNPLRKFPTTGSLEEDIAHCQLALGRCLTVYNQHAEEA